MDNSIEVDWAELSKIQPSGKSGAKPSICFVTVEFHGMFRNGGIGTANTALALALARQGFAVTVAFANADASGPRLEHGDFSSLKAHYARLGVSLDYVSPCPGIPQAFNDPQLASWSVYQYLRTCTFDAVLFNDNCGQGYYTMLAKRMGVYAPAPHLLVVAHGPVDWVCEINDQEYSYETLPLTFMEARGAALADTLVSPSRYLLDWMRGRGWVAPEQGLVLQNLIGITARKLPQTRRQVRELVFFGRQEIRKGIGLFCDALDELVATCDLSDTRVTFLGKFSNIGRLHSGVYIAERARRWSIPIRILTEYGQDEALTYLRQPGMLAVIPSRAENSPCVVAECLLQGIPFLAANSGGTAELVDAEDRDTCLFTPTPGELAARLETCLANGHAPGHMAVPQAETEAQWVKLLTSPPTVARVAVPLVSLSVCLAADASPEFAACLASVKAQTGVALEIIAAPLTPLVDLPGVTLLPGRFSSRAAARNAAAARASGTHLLFIEETAAVLARDAAATLLSAAHGGADILTCMQAPDATQANALPQMPLGGCLEHGLELNCYGEGAFLVRRAAFGDGFAEDGPERASSWRFFARATAIGATLELVPAPLVQLRAKVATPDGGMLVEERRYLLRDLAGLPLGRAAKLLECAMRVEMRLKLQTDALAEELSGPASQAVRNLRDLAPNSAAARGQFVEFCCATRLTALALDYALHNDTAIFPAGVQATVKLSEADARRAFTLRDVALRHDLDVTNELRPRLQAFHGLTAEEVRLDATQLCGLDVPVGVAVLKIARACPPGSTALRVSAKLTAGPAPRLAAVLCRARAQPVLDGNGLQPTPDAWWSGWDTPEPDAVMHVQLQQTASEPLDLYLVSDAQDPASLIWQRVAVTLGLDGIDTPRGLEIRGTATRLPMALMQHAEILTDVSGVQFDVFMPGPPVLLHPVAGRLSVARVRGMLPTGSIALKCVVSLGHEQSHPVEFAAWAYPAGEGPDKAVLPGPEVPCSGWVRVEKSEIRQKLLLQLPAPCEAPLDIYIATQVPDRPNSHFCHSRWHEFVALRAQNSGGLRAQNSGELRAQDPGKPSPEKPAPLLPHMVPAAPSPTWAVQHSYIICAAPRTGSNLLAAALRQTGCAGMPMEYYNLISLSNPTLLARLGYSVQDPGPEDFAARLDRTLHAGTDGGPVFGVTVHWYDLPNLLTAIRPRLADPDMPPLEALRAVLPGLRFIWLRRENKVAQAVSHYLARHTGRWQVLAHDDMPTEAEIPFDAKELGRLVAQAEDEEAGWRSFLAEAPEDTLALTYEAFAADYEETLARALGFIGLPRPPQGLSPPPLQRQATPRSIEVERLFRAGQKTPDARIMPVQTVRTVRAPAPDIPVATAPQWLDSAARAIDPRSIY